MLSAEQRQRVGEATVGVKVCGHGIDGQQSFELSDPAPESEANEAALAWAREARWQVTGTADSADPICTQIVVRFSDGEERAAQAEIDARLQSALVTSGTMGD